MIQEKPQITVTRNLQGIITECHVISVRDSVVEYYIEDSEHHTSMKLETSLQNFFISIVPDEDAQKFREFYPEAFI